MPTRERQFANFGEYLYRSRANLQMPCRAVKAGKRKYDRVCHMMRTKAFKASKEGRWNIRDLPAFNVAKVKNSYCRYCGKEVEHGLMEKHSFELEKMDPPFDCRFIPCKFPEPDATWRHD